MGLFDFLKKGKDVISGGIPADLGGALTSRVKDVIPDELEEKMGDIAAKASGVVEEAAQTVTDKLNQK